MVRTLLTNAWALIGIAACFNLVTVYILGRKDGMHPPLAFIIAAVTIVATQWFLGEAILVKKDVGPQIATLVTIVMIFAVLLDVFSGKPVPHWRWFGYAVLLIGVYIVNVLGAPSGSSDGQGNSPEVQTPQADADAIPSLSN